MAQSRDQRGFVFFLDLCTPLLISSIRETKSTDCDSSVNYNQGCGTTFPERNSFGQAFNGDDGGWYVMERSHDKGVKIWFWSRNDPNVPDVISQGYPFCSPDASWGTPDASFPPANCDQESHFNAHQLVFDLTLCVSTQVSYHYLVTLAHRFLTGRLGGFGVLGIRLQHFFL